MGDVVAHVFNFQWLLVLLSTLTILLTLILLALQLLKHSTASQLLIITQKITVNPDSELI